MGDSSAKAVTVLLVEDDRDLLDAFALALRVDGYEVVPADSGEAAMAAVGDRDGSPDIVLTDVVMPGMSGVELVRRLSSSRPGMKALFMSGYPDYVLHDYGLRDAQESFLRKPFSVDLLEQKIHEQLAEGPRSRGG